MISDLDLFGPPPLQEYEQEIHDACVSCINEFVERLIGHETVNAFGAPDREGLARVFQAYREDEHYIENDTMTQLMHNLEHESYKDAANLRLRAQEVKKLIVYALELAHVIKK